MRDVFLHWRSRYPFEQILAVPQLRWAWKTSWCDATAGNRVHRGCRRDETSCMTARTSLEKVHLLILSSNRSYCRSSSISPSMDIAVPCSVESYHPRGSTCLCNRTPSTEFLMPMMESWSLKARFARIDGRRAAIHTEGSQARKTCISSARQGDHLSSFDPGESDWRPLGHDTQRYNGSHASRWLYAVRYYSIVKYLFNTASLTLRPHAILQAPQILVHLHH